MVDRLTFNFSPRIILLLGGQLIKNAYDADVNNVKIEMNELSKMMVVE